MRCEVDVQRLLPRESFCEVRADLVRFPTDGTAAAAFVDEVSQARTLRAADAAVPNLAAGTWERARSFASQHGWHLTRPVLRAVVTHEVLSQKGPVALLVAGYGLTRRDLDLALTRAVGLPDVPSDADRALLRGRTAE